ncbi:MAG: hypothetical protein AAB795_01965 [Patescibacteria group bacterium]
MKKTKLLIGLGIAIILVEMLGFTDFIKQYITIALALIMVVISVWQYSESKEQ